MSSVSIITLPEHERTSSICSATSTSSSMRHDVTFPLYVEVDEIYNLACPASPVHYQHDPVQTTKTSVHGAINMLGLAKRLQAKILQASTAKFTATRQFIRRLKITGGTSIRSDHVPAMTRASVAPKRCSSIITVNTDCESRWRGFSILTVRGCILTTAGWFQTSLFKRCSVAISRSTAMASRPDRSAMSMI